MNTLSFAQNCSSQQYWQLFFSAIVDFCTDYSYLFFIELNFSINVPQIDLFIAFGDLIRFFHSGKKESLLNKHWLKIGDTLHITDMIEIFVRREKKKIRKYEHADTQIN